MGREWYWGGGSNNRSSKNGGGGGGGEVNSKERLNTSTTPSGCMCSVFQLFDFHQLNFTNSNSQQNQPSQSSDHILPPHQHDPPSKGVEAPRNSLELDQPPSLKSLKPDESLHIPMGIQIKTNGGGDQESSKSSEISSSSPSTKTPNLVARLMGLDILPDQCHSPTSTLTTPKSNPNHNHHRRQSFHNKRNNYSGTRSLPETPRVSSSSSRKSDVEHRLSLQINKENTTSPGEEIALSARLKRRELRIMSNLDQDHQENRSPGHYARQIVKQVKESVSRRVGLVDITNTTTTVKIRNLDIDDYDYSSPVKKASSCSPRLLKNKDHNNIMKSPVPENQKSRQVEEKENYGGRPRQQQQQKKAKLADPERLIGHPPQPPRLKKKPPKNKKEEAFVHTQTATRVNIPDKKFKKSRLSNDLQNVAVPTLLPVKKDPIPPATKIPQKQVLMPNLAQESKRSSQTLSNCSSHSYKHQQITTPNLRAKSNGAVITGGDHQAAEFEYITRILKRTGIQNNTPVSFTRWFSPSHPIDPSIFHYLECFAGQLLIHRSNRKLIFHLVDEILADILKPYMNIKPWANSPAISNSINGSDLIDVLCLKVRSFPGADCRVLEDIDALIDKDMSPPAVKVQISEMAFGEEGEGIVIEVEKDILDTLVHETAAFLLCG